MRCAPIIVPGCKIFAVGEAPGKNEAELGTPFIGGAGQELNLELSSVGISRAEISLSNVFMERPKDNNILEFFTDKKEGCKEIAPLKVKQNSKYVRREYAGELLRLKAEIESIRPNLVLALGNTALWALCQTNSIMKERGFVRESTLIPGQKVLPTVHPAGVMREWKLRPIVLTDYIKAKMESEFPEIRRPKREIWIEPTLADMEDFYIRYLKPAKMISFDIETKDRQITCIAFTDDPSRSLVVPFLDRRKPAWSYWKTAEEEVRAWNFVANVLALQAEKLGQNGMYDLQYLWRVNGIPVRNYRHDLMLLHHTLQPEMPKGLGFLGSIYTNERAWKDMRDSLNIEKPNE